MIHLEICRTNKVFTRYELQLRLNIDKYDLQLKYQLFKLFVNNNVFDDDSVENFLLKCFYLHKINQQGYKVNTFVISKFNNIKEFEQTTKMLSMPKIYNNRYNKQLVNIKNVMYKSITDKINEDDTLINDIYLIDMNEYLLNTQTILDIQNDMINKIEEFGYIEVE